MRPYLNVHLSPQHHKKHLNHSKPKKIKYFNIDQFDVKIKLTLTQLYNRQDFSHLFAFCDRRSDYGQGLGDFRIT